MAYYGSSTSASSGVPGNDEEDYGTSRRWFYQFTNNHNNYYNNNIGHWPWGGDTKVFVGGLAWETQSHTLHQHFQQFGHILEAVVITDKYTARSKGYGFVTFRDPECARRACADPTPIIDGRRANCNLASLGRPPSIPFPAPYIGSVPPAQRAYVGGFGFQQPVTYGYQQGLAYPPYGYTTYSPEVVYQQGVYNPYMGQQYLHVYGVPGTMNPSSMYPYNQVGQTISTAQGYTTVPGRQIMQFGGHNSLTAAAIPPNQAPYPSGIGATVPGQPQYIVRAHSSQFVQGSSSDQTAG